MTPEQFKEWRMAMGFRSREAAAQALDISSSTVELYETGKRRDNGLPVTIPFIVELACIALELIYQEPPWPPRRKSIPVYKIGDDSNFLYQFTPVNSSQCKCIGSISAPIRTTIVQHEGEEALSVPGFLNPLQIVKAINCAQNSMFPLSWEGYNWIRPGA